MVYLFRGTLKPTHMDLGFCVISYRAMKVNDTTSFIIMFGCLRLLSTPFYGTHLAFLDNHVKPTLRGSFIA